MCVLMQKPIKTRGDVSHQRSHLQILVENRKTYAGPIYLCLQMLKKM